MKTATFYINKNDNLVMKNHGGTNEFFRATDENMKMNNELYQKEQERKAKERQKMQDEFKNYSIIPSGD